VKFIFRFGTLLLAVGFAGIAAAQDANSVPVREPTLRRELLERVAKDQAIRQELISKGVDKPDPEVLDRMASIDAENAKRVAEIVDQFGWPGPELVGRDGSQAAFLLVQHADLGLQKKMLPLVETAWEGGALPGQSYALLLDRVRVGEGKPQVYGTQAKPFEEWKGREPVLQPIEDEANVDNRRADVGLPPLAEYRETLKQMYFPESQYEESSHDKDQSARRRTFSTGAAAVCWRRADRLS
jgi:hypothetical protein